MSDGKPRNMSGTPVDVATHNEESNGMTGGLTRNELSSGGVVFRRRLSSIKLAMATFIWLFLVPQIAISGTNNPPEVEALIGVHIPAKSQGVPGRLQGWASLSSVSLDTPLSCPYSIGIEEITNYKTSLFIVDRFDGRDGSRTILDAQVIQYWPVKNQTKNRNPPMREALPRARLELNCKSNGDTNRIVAIAQQRAGMEHCSNAPAEILKAWRVDTETGKITEVPALNVSCTFVTEFECLQ